MSIRDEVRTLIEQLSDGQLAELLPPVLTLHGATKVGCSSESSQAYQDWLSSRTINTITAVQTPSSDSSVMPLLI